MTAPTATPTTGRTTGRTTGTPTGRVRRALPAALVAVLLGTALLPGPAAGAPAPRPDLVGVGGVGVEEDAATGSTALALVTGQTEPIYTQFVTESYEVPTPHGTIRGDVRRPVVPDGVTVPVILTYTPYSVLYQSLSPTRASRAHDATGAFFVPRGYARAVFDVVGTYGSDGCTDFGGAGERETGAAVVEFLAAQPWSSGRVGMIGASYDGTTAIAAAVESPEHLVTIVPQVAIDRWYDYMYNDGVRMTLEDNATGLIDPPIDSPADYDLVYGVVPPYHLLAEDPQGVAAVLADHMTPCNRVTNQVRGHETDPVYDDFWVERDYRALADRVEASVLLEGAWLDDNVKHWASTRFFEALRARPARDPDAADGGWPQTMLTIGQWSHSTSRFDFAADLRHAWFDHHLLGLDTGVQDMPAVITQASSGLTTPHDTWPPAGVAEVDVALPVGPATTFVDADPTMPEQVITADACGLRCVTWTGLSIGGPGRIMGEPVVEVTLRADAASTHLVAVLHDVSPTGVRTPIARGLLNTNVREGLDRLVPMVPGAPVTVRVPLWPVDHVLAPGRTLALTLSSTNSTWGLSDTTRATVTVDAARLTLPVLRG